MPLFGKATCEDVYGSRSFGSTPRWSRCLVNDDSGGAPALEAEAEVDEVAPPCEPELEAEAKQCASDWRAAGACGDGRGPR